MRILYISQYFPPEAGATQTRAYEMASNFVRMGHQVTMLAEVPNHPSGIIPPEYQGKLFERANLDGIEVIRVWVKTSPTKNFRNRMLFYLTFMINATLAGLFLARGHYDMVYATSPPLFVGGAALAISTLRRIPLVFEIRDLWPESAVALGEISNPHTIAWSTRLEEACYHRARAVIVVTHGIRQRLLERGVPAEKVIWIPNGANTDLFQFRPQSRQKIRLELGLNDKFVAIYAGIHGVAQGLEYVIEAARLLQTEAEIQVLMVGDGPKKGEITALAKQYELSNLTLLPEQPRERIVDYLSAADIALIPLRNLELFKGALPSKMFDAWACQRPILLSVDGEARSVMEQCGGGIFIPPEDPKALSAALLKLKDSPQSRSEMGAAGRAYTIQHYSRKALAEQLAAILKKLV